MITFIALPSCLEMGLEDLPTYSDAEINSFKFEYRWSVKEGPSDVLRVKPLDVDQSINKEAGTIHIKIRVPKADGSFTESVRDQVTLKNIVGYCSISTAATIRPLDGAPRLGAPGDFSKSPLKYLVTAADGKTTKEWTITVDPIDK